jgi:hypothetical protein
MPITVNGCGTKYYGKRDLMPDGSYITTEWIVIFYIPLIPIRSFRALPTNKSFLGIPNEYLVQKVPLNLKQIRNIYIKSVTILGGMITAAGVLTTVIALSESTDSQTPSPNSSPQLSKPHKN